ncbi:MAG: hypothetical protein A2Y14_05080 [Verrucomicrobia bacterium GWF2_51_19]|nr:MAG: hypothetical protein A2Y14_05080 [Verrucomicrobia bacterium GWF2_51_19]HCJ11736.1 hypothetical protein [Opitutae bacterium]
MKWILFFPVVCFAEVTLPSMQEYSNGIAAVVNGKPITLETIRKEISPLASRVQVESKSLQDFQDRVVALQKEVLERIIEKELVVSAFEKSGGQIPENYLDSLYQDYIKDEFDGNRDNFMQFLKAQYKTEKSFKTELRDRAIVDYMREKVRHSIAEISPRKIQDYYLAHKEEFLEPEAVHFRQIMVKLPDANTKVEAVQKALKEGIPFADVAIKYSEDSKAIQGGDWGWIHRGDLRAELNDPAFSLEKGQYKGPITVNDFVFFVYAEDKKAQGYVPLETVKARVEHALSEFLTKQAYEKWIQELKDKASIRRF